MQEQQAHDIAPALLAILRVARDAGLPSMTRTALVKHLYLLDYSTAEETRGQPWTNAHWRFLHFGPFDGAVADSIDALLGQGRIEEQTSSDKDKDYFLYQLPASLEVRSLADLGVSMHDPASIRRTPSQAAMRLDSAFTGVR